MVEDSVRSDDGRYDSSDAKKKSVTFENKSACLVQHSPIECLREIDTNLRVLGRTTNGDIRVCSSFQTPQTVADDEDSRTESTERVVYEAGPGHCWNQRLWSMEAFMLPQNESSHLKSRFRKGTSPR